LNWQARPRAYESSVFTNDFHKTINENPEGEIA
jgi:hypothetical protein